MLNSVQVISPVCWIIWKCFVTVITVVTFAHCSILLHNRNIFVILALSTAIQFRFIEYDLKPD